MLGLGRELVRLLSFSPVRLAGRNRETATGVWLPPFPLLIVLFLSHPIHLVPAPHLFFSINAFSFSSISSKSRANPPSHPTTPHDPQRYTVMDQHQQPPIHDEQSQNFVPSQYAMYPASEDDQSYLVYPPPIPGYQGVVQQHPGPPPRGFMQSALPPHPQPRSDLPFPVSFIVFFRAIVRQ